MRKSQHKLGLSVATLLVSFLVTSSHPFSPAVATSGDPIPTPISFYKFDQTDGDTTIIDSIRGSAGLGTNVNGPTFAPGKVGNAICFNGSSQYSTAPVAADGLTEFTISAWVKIDTHTNWGTIVKNWGSSRGTFHLGLDGMASSSMVWSNYVGLTTVPQSQLGARSNSASVLNTWTNITTTGSQSNGKMLFYVNGVKQTEEATWTSGSIASIGTLMSFGAKLNDAQTAPVATADAGYLDGCVDEVAFWGEALTADQISDINSLSLSASSPIPSTPDPAGPRPNSVSGLTATPGNQSTTLSWTPSPGGAAATDFRIEFSTDGGTTWTLVNDGVSTSTSYTVTGLSGGTLHAFRVSALNAGGASGPISRTATPTGSAIVPPPPVVTPSTPATQPASIAQPAEAAAPLNLAATGFSSFIPGVATAAIISIGVLALLISRKLRPRSIR